MSENPTPDESCVPYNRRKTYLARALILECQNTNTKAIDFYIKNEFELIGFDLEAYTKDQGNSIEIRLEMGKNLL